MIVEAKVVQKKGSGYSSTKAYLSGLGWEMYGINQTQSH